METQMNTAQYDAIMDKLQKLDSLEMRVGDLEKELHESYQSTIHWVMGLFVAALLVNGPVIGAIVSIVILKMV